MNIGCDIEDISRFDDKTLDKESKFLYRIFTKKELDYCFKNKNYSSHLAARFCAKEAVIKALSGLYDKHVSYNKIEILKKDNKIPYINILDKKLEEKNYRYSLTISHEKNKAVAFVVIEE